MKLYLNMDKKAMVVTKSETPYSVEGNTGVTYRLGIVFEGDVEKVKCVNKETFDKIQIRTEYILTGELEVRNGKSYEWKVNGFIPTK